MENVKDVLQNWLKDSKRGIKEVHCSKWLGYEMVSEMHKAFHSILAATILQITILLLWFHFKIPQKYEEISKFREKLSDEVSTSKEFFRCLS